MKKEWFESERMRAKPESAYLPARSYGKTFASRTGAALSTRPDLRARVTPADRDDTVTYLYPLLDKIATFDKVWLAGKAGSDSVTEFCRVFKNAQFLSPEILSYSVPIWADKCLVTLLELRTRPPFYQEDVQRWVDSEMPVFAFDLSVGRMKRLLNDWAELPLKTLP